MVYSFYNVSRLLSHITAVRKPTQVVVTDLTLNTCRTKRTTTYKELTSGQHTICV